MGIIKDITLGQYLPGDSFVHRLDPRTKMISLLMVIIAAFGTADIFALFLLLISILAVTRLAGLSMSFLLKGSRFFFWLFAFTAIFHVFFTAGDSIYPFTLLGVNVTSQGIKGGTVVFLQLLSVVLAANIFTLTTSPLKLTRGLEAALKPLDLLGIKAEEAALMISLVIRFIPILKEEAIKVLKAQRARGIEFGKGSLPKRTKSIVSVIGPVFTALFVRADSLALAMVSRGFGGKSERGAFMQLRFRRSDVLALFATAVFSLSIFFKY